MDFQLLSNAFKHEGLIPDLYTCKGKNISPPLNWINPPGKTMSYAMIMVDLDTPLGTLTHWVIYNIPSDKLLLDENIPHGSNLLNGIIQGRNSMRRNQYMGPCPPWGKHRYFFTLYALDTKLEEDPKINKGKLMRLMKNHILSKAELMGNYSKKS